MLALVGVVVLGAAVGSGPVKVAVPGFTVSGVDGVQGEAWVDRFVTLLGAEGAFKLTTSRDIQQVLGIERQRELLGCTDAQASCLAELAGALGVDAILTGTVAKSGAGFSATLRALRAGDGSQVAAVTGRLKDIDALQDWLDAQVPEVSRQLRVAFGLVREDAAGLTPGVASTGSSSRVRLVPVIAGGLIAVAGGVLFGLSKGNAATLKTTPLTREQIDSNVTTGRTLEGVGLGMLIAGAVVLAVGVVWLIVGARS